MVIPHTGRFWFPTTPVVLHTGSWLVLIRIGGVLPPYGFQTFPVPGVWLCPHTVGWTYGYRSG